MGGSSLFSKFTQPSPHLWYLIGKSDTDTRVRSNNMSIGKFWAAFGVGVVAGAALALIYAPQTGERTRRQIRRGYEDAADRLRSTAKSVRSTANDVSDQAGKYIKRGKDAVSDVVDSAQDLANAASKRVSSFR
jgi:gas vesicle protein